MHMCIKSSSVRDDVASTKVIMTETERNQILKNTFQKENHLELIMNQTWICWGRLKVGVF